MFKEDKRVHKRKRLFHADWLVLENTEQVFVDEFMKWATGTPGFMTGLRPDELEDSLRAFYLSTGTPTMSKRPWKQMLQNVFLYHRFLAATKSQMLAGRDGVENRGVGLEIHLIASLYGRK